MVSLIPLVTLLSIQERHYQQTRFSRFVRLLLLVDFHHPFKTIKASFANMKILKTSFHNFCLFLIFSQVLYLRFLFSFPCLLTSLVCFCGFYCMLSPHSFFCCLFKGICVQFVGHRILPALSFLRYITYPTNLIILSFEVLFFKTVSFKF